MHKVILFDFDGTIADSLENFLSILMKISTKHGLPSLSRDEIEKFRSQDPRSIIKSLKIPLYKIPFIALDMKKMQQSYIEEISVFKDLPQVLTELKSMGYRLGILTSNGRENVKLFIKRNEIEVFDYIYSDASMFGKDKVIKGFLKEHQIERKDVLYVGDEIRDILACKKAGVKIVSVTWGFNSKEGLIEHHPDFIIDTPTQLLTVLMT